MLEKLKTKELCLAAIRQAKGVLQRVPEEMRETVLTAVRQESADVSVGKAPEDEEGAGPRPSILFFN